MKYFNRILGSLILIILVSLIFQNFCKSVSNVYNTNGIVPLKIGVLEYKSDDQYILEVHKSLEQIQKENEGKVEFIFVDCKNSQEIQNLSINNFLQGGIDILFVNLVDITEAKTVIDMIKQKNVPVILYNREPPIKDSIRSYNRAIFVGTDPSQAGILQGNIITRLWKSNKGDIDKNGDGKIGYIMLKGEPNNIETIERSRYSILTINNAGIETNELEAVYCNWSEDTAKYFMQTLYLSYGNKIEFIISNNDAMAIGAVKALQKYGFNTGDPKKMIPIVGVDAIPEAREYINKGYMTGTVLQDANEMAKVLYMSGVNLFNGRSAIEGIPYGFDDTGVSIRIPYKEYPPINK
ncbi:galactose ABC transporter substrate-binding protein [Clostridium sp. HBUAS56017]|uniref:galactose ABC transporter substrate-binding protein n=1 Tax=Clostridium sp. HBUAS56017 TaxID=2571128 RepID=UPI0011786B21|nr:galactose ABC transporter substrate-binding protein [Clostridium sp. HBUAS56017]